MPAATPPRPCFRLLPAPVWVLLLALLGADSAPSGSLAEEEDLPALSSLYEHRLRFDASGQPVVTVGLMDGRKEVVVQAKGGMRLRFRDPKVPGATRLVELAAGRRLTVTLKAGKPARVRTWAVVDTLERDDRASREEVRARWQKGGWGEARLFEVGGIYGVEGTVVDNRASLVAIPVPASGTADLVCTRVYEQTGVRCRPHDELLDTPRGTLALRDDAGDLRGTAADLLEVTPLGGTLTVEQVEHSVGYKNHGFQDRVYGDRVVVAVDAKGMLSVVNALHVDRLLAGIVPSEIFPNAHPEALKAQAVTARGEVFAKIGLRHLTDPHMLCDDQHCQVYSGVSAEREGCTVAVNATRGEMTFLGPRLVDSVYSAMCGGRTEDNDVVWEVPASAALRGRVDAEGAAALQAATVPGLEHGGLERPVGVLEADLEKPVAHPGLLAAADLSGETALRRFLAEPPPAFCAQASLGKKDKFRWTRRFTQEETTARCKDLGVGTVTGLHVEARGRSGRVRTLRVEGSAGQAFVHRELPVRRLFGNLPSGLFVLDAETGDGGGVLAWVFTGAGFGHGVGMCQTGAVGMAEAGHDYRSILRHYYNGADVRRVY
jgi:peptidoglycan hydrolase-like amidase